MQDKVPKPPRAKTSAGSASGQTPLPAATLLSAPGPMEADPQESLEAHCFEVGVRVRSTLGR